MFLTVATKVVGIENDKIIMKNTTTCSLLITKYLYIYEIPNCYLFSKFGKIAKHFFSKNCSWKQSSGTVFIVRVHCSYCVMKNPTLLQFFAQQANIPLPYHAFLVQISYVNSSSVQNNK